MFERLIASSLIAAVCPGVNVSVAVDASTCKPRHAAMILSNSAFFSGLHDSSRIPFIAWRNFNKSGTDAAGSAGLNFEVISRISVATDWEFGTRDQLVSTPSKSELVIG